MQLFITRKEVEVVIKEIINKPFKLEFVDKNEILLHVYGTSIRAKLQRVVNNVVYINYELPYLKNLLVNIANLFTNKISSNVPPFINLDVKRKSIAIDLNEVEQIQRFLTIFSIVEITTDTSNIELFFALKEITK